MTAKEWIEKVLTSITTLAYCNTSSSLGAPLYSA